MSLAQESYYEELLEAGVRIHVYGKKFLHAKHLSIDDAVTVIGTNNLDIRSFALNAEVMLIINGDLNEISTRSMRLDFADRECDRGVKPLAVFSI